MNYKTFKKLDKLEGITIRMNDLEQDLIASVGENQQLKDKLLKYENIMRENGKAIVSYQNKLHRRNMQIEDLKKDINILKGCGNIQQGIDEGLKIASKMVCQEDERKILSVILERKMLNA